MVRGLRRSARPSARAVTRRASRTARTARRALRRASAAGGDDADQALEREHRVALGALDLRHRSRRAPGSPCRGPRRSSRRGRGARGRPARARARATTRAAAAARDARRPWPSCAASWRTRRRSAPGRRRTVERVPQRDERLAVAARDRGIGDGEGVGLDPAAVVARDDGSVISPVDVGDQLLAGGRELGEVVGEGRRRARAGRRALIAAPGRRNSAAAKS